MVHLAIQSDQVHLFIRTDPYTPPNGYREIDQRAFLPSDEEAIPTSGENAHVCGRDQDSIRQQAM